MNSFGNIMESLDNILEMRNISKSFNGVHALQNVSFACRRGTVHALLGENGAGKSTLIKILSGAYQSDSGEILYDGRRFTHLSTARRLASASGSFTRNWRSCPT